MTNYKNAKIYKLVSPNGLVYIGSTCQSLATRKVDHKNAYKRWKRGTSAYVTSGKLFEEAIDDIDIVLLEECPCENNEQLHARERHYIDTIECVNKCVPLRTRSEYRSSIIERERELTQCSCGSEIQRCAISRHCRTQKHQQWLLNEKQTEAQPTV